MTSNSEKQVFKQLEEVMKKCDNLSQEIKDLKRKHKIEIFELNEKNSKEVKDLNQRIDTLKKENKKLKEENDILKGKAIQKNSTNSNIPPSKDEFKVQNHREKSSRKKGGQKGRKGKTLSEQEIKKLIETGKAEVEEEHYGDKNAKTEKIKYILDLKVKVIIRKIMIHGNIEEYPNEDIPIECKNTSTVVYGNNLKALVSVMYAQEVIAFDRISEFLSILTDNILSVSHGSLVNWISQTSKGCKKIKKKMAKALRRTKVISTDLTTTSLNGQYAYTRNYSNC